MSDKQGGDGDGEAEQVTFPPIEIINLSAETIFAMSADEVGAAGITTAGDLCKHMPFRRAFTDMAFPTSNYTEKQYEKLSSEQKNMREFYPLHLTGLVLEDADEELKDDDELRAADDGVVHLHVFPKPFEHFKKANNYEPLSSFS